jgi:GntR family transcriptional regulator, transcriptional repressor for pyruvate dehydrogenase complex
MRVTDQAIDRIKQMIVSGELGPGDRLPREAELAERLGLSRNSLREAVTALALVRVLDVRRGDGTYVTSLAPDLLLGTFALAVDLHPDGSLLEFFELRRILEPAATAKAALLMSRSEVDRLRRSLDDLGPEPSLEELLAADLEFHRLIAEGGRNRAVSSILDSLRRPTYRARIWRGRSQPDAIRQTLAEHRAILDAIAARDPDLARSCATVHVAGVERWLREREVSPCG